MCHHFDFSLDLDYHWDQGEKPQQKGVVMASNNNQQGYGVAPSTGATIFVAILGAILMLTIVATLVGSTG